jgi:hypothetical protein
VPDGAARRAAPDQLALPQLLLVPKGETSFSVRVANDEEQVVLSLVDQRARDDDGILLAYLVAIEKTNRKIVPLRKQ